MKSKILPYATRYLRHSRSKKTRFKLAVESKQLKHSFIASFYQSADKYKGTRVL